MRKVILLTAMPKESVWSSSIYVNGGSKVTFCVKHNLISTFFNFVFYCTLVFIMCFLTAGNICAQTTSLSLTGGINYDKHDIENGTLIMFRDNQNNRYCIGYSHVGGESWAATWQQGETHTFTVTLLPHTLEQYDSRDVVGELHIVALDCEMNKGFDSYIDNIVAEAWIDPIDNNTNNVLTLQVNQPYKAVCLFKTPRANTSGSQHEYVKIASVTRTVEESVVISESANNNITEINDKTVKLYRSLTANTWNTICLPFAPTQAHVDAIFGEGAKFAQFSSVSNGVMQFKSVAVGSLVAGKPYLVLPTRSQTAQSPIELTGVTIPATAIEPKTVTQDNYQFKGIYKPTPFPINDRTIRFVAAGNKLKYPSTANPNKQDESTPLKALRAYFILPGVSSSAKDYFYDVDSFVPTSIANIQIEGDGDGDGAIYNIGGQRVEGKSLPKGIYIRDGKKFVVK